jgi:serine/threonine-protein kinase
MAPESVGPYRIVEKLGSGGMGDVYLAEDTRLGRKVALKSLTREWAQAPDARRRLEREARAAAGLNHKNIAGVYDVLDAPEASYIVMEYAPGESLAEALKRGPLPPEAVVFVGVQLCDALAAAHARGIVHRDLKPANLILAPDGQLKVLDFGLAKSLDLDPGFVLESGEVTLSSGGRLVGTLPYVPPEHVLGEPVDERSDIYAAGVVLYELLTGHRPFDAPDKKALAQAIVDGEPPDLLSLRPELPEELARVVKRAMARDPARRPTTAVALRAELSELSGAHSGWKTLTDLERPIGLRSTSGAARRRARRRNRLIAAAAAAGVLGLVVLVVGGRGRVPSAPERPPVIAVLPLSNASGDAAYDPVLIGFADLIVSALAGLPGVNVVSRSAVMEQREHLAQPTRLARELGADLLVDGSVQRSASRVRVALSVVKAGSNVVGWSRVFEGAGDDLFELQRSVAQAVAEAVRGGISAEDLARIERAVPVSEAALAKYGEARKLLDRGDVSGNPEKAIALFEEALEEAPRFALAAAGLAEAYWAKYAGTKDGHDAEEARRALDRALAFDPDQPQVRLALAEHLGKTGKAAEAIEELDRVLHLQPSSDDAHRRRGQLLLERGRVEEGLAELHRARDLRPGFWRNHYSLGLAFFDLGRYREAVSSWTRVTELQPDSAWGHLALGAAQQAAGDRRSAASNYRRSIDLDPSPQAWSNIGQVAYVEGRYDAAREAFEAALRLDPNHAPAYRNLGDLYKRLGDRERALRRYERAVERAEEAVRVNPGSALDHARLAVYQAKAGRVSAALGSIQRALELSPENVEVLYRRAVVCALAGRRAEARETLERALARGYSRALAMEDEDVAGLLPAEGS